MADSYSSHVKVLGVYFDDKLKFDTHLKIVIWKTYCSFKMLYSNIFLNARLACYTVLRFNICSILDSVYHAPLTVHSKGLVRVCLIIKKIDHVCTEIKSLRQFNKANSVEYCFSVLLQQIFKNAEPLYLREKMIFTSLALNINNSSGCLVIPHLCSKNRSPIGQWSCIISYTYNS